MAKKISADACYLLINLVYCKIGAALAREAPQKQAKKQKNTLFQYNSLKMNRLSEFEIPAKG
ncbi:MAG: hypothetical protein SFW35_08980 [Chitinophagales bacterium]|nr:hypothetical protein [Chitinophagales bacterium]